MICEDCCQISTKKVKCQCLGGEPSTKHIGRVSGCIIYANSKRCKLQCNQGEEVCHFHTEIGLEKDEGFIKKIFDKK